MAKPKRGDVVHVKAMVVNADDDGPMVVMFDGYMSVLVPQTAIVHVESAPLKVGDSVVRIGVADEMLYEVIALNFGTVWIRRGDFQHLISETMIRRTDG